jgi:phosphatidylinositol alpha-mannosyltransferase
VLDGENGFLIPAGDAQALAARITLLLDDPDCRAELSAHARAYAQEYAWPHIVARMLEVYEATMAAAAGSTGVRAGLGG